MLILLEGPELAGKTTLAERLRDEHGFTVLHRGPPQVHPLLEYERTLELEEESDAHIVLDRWHVGELIYGPLLRGASSIDAAMTKHIDLFLQARGCVVVILNPEIAELDRRWTVSAKEQLITWTQELQVRQAYHDYGYQHTEALRYSYIDETRLRYLLDEANDREGRTAWLRRYGMYVGSHNPEWLFVGDRPARTHRNGHLAAFIPYEGSSGHYLLSALLAQPTLSSFGLTNANVEQDTHDLWELLGQPNVVALGVNAAAALDRMNVPCAMAPHPQYVRRFWHARCKEYGEALIHAAETGEDVALCTG